MVRLERVRFLRWETNEEDVKDTVDGELRRMTTNVRDKTNS